MTVKGTFGMLDSNSECKSEVDERISSRNFGGLKIIITGGAGFIGSHIVEKLLPLGANVTVIDNFLRESKIEHLRGHACFSIYEADITDAKSINKLFNDCDMIFHLAAVVGVEETQIAPVEVLNVEVQGTINIFNFAVENKIKKIIFGSSSEVYGDSDKPMKEESTLSPISTYAVTKLLGEEYCKAFYQKYGIEYAILRYFNIYGPRQDERFVISRFINRALAHQDIIIYGDGKQTRDFTYIDDAVNMTLLSSIEEKARCQEINVGTGISASINELATLVSRSLNNEHPVQSIYVDYDNKRPRGIEIFRRTADIHKAKSILEYEPVTSLKSGIENYTKWYRESGV
jgi:UDP-glucose 4-epimerase